MARAAAAVLVGLLAGASGAPLDDLQRARTRVPRAEFRGRNFAEMGAVLTGHLRKALGDRVVECGNFTVADLRSLQVRLFRESHGDLVSVYADRSDNRRERHISEEGMKAFWDSLLTNTPKEAHEMLRDGLCHEVVMRFAHHTTEEVRRNLAQEPGFVLPTLPQHEHTHDGRAETVAAHHEYKALSGCQACHSRLVPPPSPELPADCKTQLTSQCGKYGQLSKDLCTACTAQHAAQLSACSAAQTQAFCGHKPACIGADECPVWPEEFSSPFTLHSTIPYINGAKCNFYYKYNSELQAQTVDYYEKCFPFVNALTPFFNKPCKLFFNPKGIYLSQPGRVDCCKLLPDVGAPPPEFLQSFTRTAQDVLAPDMIGNQVKCDEWHGPDGFKYWTVGKNDAIYHNFGHDIVFQDGPTGVTWRWGNFTVGPQSDSLFQLPAGNCEKSCLLPEAEMRSLQQDLHVRRSTLAAGGIPAQQGARAFMV